MSSLVAYASSDDSDSDDGEVEERNGFSSNNQSKEKPSQKDVDVTITRPVSRIEPKTTTTNKGSSSKEKNADVGDNSDSEENMFRALPTPSTKVGSTEDQPEEELEELVKPKKSQMTCLPKPLPLPNKPVQISIPTLDSDSDEEEVVAKKKPKFSGSGNLLDILPPPKHMSIKQANRTLIPHTLSKKPPPVKKVPSAKVPSKTPASKILADYNNSDEDDEDITEGSNFFSLDTDKKTEQLAYFAPLSTYSLSRDTDIYSVHPPPPPPPPPSSNVVTSASYIQHSHVESGPQNTDLQMYPQYEIQSAEPFYQQNSFDPQPSSSDPNLSNMDELLQDEQFLRLQGKNQRGKEQIHIMDVNTDDFIDTSELTKTLTQEMPKHSHKKSKDAPSKQSRSKHQITYLAYQAKERELELKNQWSQNKLTKRQTQAKYGF